MKPPQFTKHIHRNAHFMARLAQCRSSKRRSALLSAAGPEQLLCIVESCLNILRGRVRPTIPNKVQNGKGKGVEVRRTHLWRRLRACAPWIRALAKVRSARRAKSMLLNQTGKGLPAIAASVAANVLLPWLAERLQQQYVLNK